VDQESPFLDAIRANPHDKAARLVYADWLEERADARGELIRIEAEMRTLPVFSDRFWELKPRRHALRKRMPTSWLAEMCYLSDCPPTFAHHPTNWMEWWRLIRVFTERWHNFPSLPDVGGRQAEILEVETRLGKKLPPSVREWVAFAHDVRSQDYFCVLRDVYQMRELEGHHAISLLLLCEGDVQWAVRNSDLDKQDPPIYTYGWDHNASDPETTCVPKSPDPESPSLTSFVLDYSLGYVHSNGGGFGTDLIGNDSKPFTQKLQKDFPVHFVHNTFEIFEKDNILVWLYHWPGREYLRVELFKPMPRDSIPEFLWAQTNHGGMFHGLFVSQS
jgi:uncharacterized protein (TIGR02996 family)